MIKNSKVRKSLKSFNIKKLNTLLVINPDSLFRFIWDLFIMLTILTCAVLVPIDNSFIDDNSDFSAGLSIFLTSVFSLDILLTINSGIYIKGEQVMKRKRFICVYFRFWFWIDFISTFPFDFFLYRILGNQTVNKSVVFNDNLNVLRALKLLKLIRLTRIGYLLIKIEDRIQSKTNTVIFKFIKILVSILLVANWAACLMFFVSSKNLSPNSFVASIENKGISDSVEMYVSSLYWAIVTMVSIGYGDFHPENTNERILGIVIMNLSSIIFGYLAGSFGSILGKHTAKNKERGEMVVNINKIMKIHNLPTELKKKALNHINYIYTRYKNNVNLEDLLKNLSFALRKEIFSYINGDIIKSYTLFSDLPESCISQISKVLIPNVNSPNDVIFKENSNALNMFFILKGSVLVLDERTSSCINKLLQMEYFGELGMFMRKLRSASIYCDTFVETLALQLTDLESVSLQHPVLARTLDLINKAAELNDMNVLKIECYLCGKADHIAKNCEKLTEKVKNKEKWLQSKKQGKILDSGNYKAKNSYFREKKQAKFKLNIKNVWGKKRKLKDIYPKDKHFYQIIKEFSGEPSKFGHKNSCLSRISLFSKDEEAYEYLRSFKNYENLLDSEEEQQIFEQKEKIRKREFDSTLLDSTFYGI